MKSLRLQLTPPTLSKCCEHATPVSLLTVYIFSFVKTKGMSKLLQEGTKRRQEQAAITAAQALQQTQSKQKKPIGAQPSVGLPQVVAANSAVGSTAASGSGDQSLLDLVANVKRKLGDETASGDVSGGKKKRRRR